MIDLFQKRSNHVVFINSPPYKRASAGVTALHILCDYLNRSGVTAYMVPDHQCFGKFGYTDSHSHNGLITPVISRRELIRLDNDRTNIPVMIYPETVDGNPFKIKNIIRYILYYDGDLTPSESQLDYNRCDIGIICYSANIFRSLQNSYAKAKFITQVSIPVCNRMDMQKFIRTEKEGAYYYAEKHIHVFGKDIPEEIANSCTRITRDQGDSPTSEELYQILGSAKIIHVFEESAIIYEALLAGCVVNLHPTGSFKESGKTLTEDELGLAGTISQQAPTEQDIKDAQLEIPTHIDNYNKWVSNAEVDIRRLVENLSYFTQTNHDDFYGELWKNVRLCDRYVFLCNIDIEKKISYKVVKACASIFPLIIRKKIRRGYKNFYNSLPTIMKIIL